MKIALALVGALSFLIVASLPAGAATSMAYSEADGMWGWAANYSGFTRANSTAEAGCSDAGGSECEVKLECPNGAGAIAEPDDGGSGIGMACGLEGADYARVLALVMCGINSQTLCWTRDSFNNDGSQNSADANKVLDLTFYGQEMLFVLGYDPGDVDGRMGPRTRSAMKEFQKNMGLAQTGDFDEDTIYLMVAMAGGPQDIIRSMDEVIIQSLDKDYDGLLYGHSESPRAIRDYPEEVATWSSRFRLSALAAMLTNWDSPCTIPAISAAALGAPEDGIWNIECDEGDYNLVLDDKNHTITKGFATADDETPPPLPDDTPPKVEKKTTPDTEEDPLDDGDTKSKTKGGPSTPTSEPRSKEKSK